MNKPSAMSDEMARGVNYGLAYQAHRFCSALANAEVQIDDEDLLMIIVECLALDDKLAAQAAATCLIDCGGERGKELFQSALELNHLPQEKLIRGIWDLLVNS